MKSLAVFLLLAIGLWPLQAQIQPASSPQMVELPVYTFSHVSNQIQVEMDYASSTIKNPEIKKLWTDKTVYQVDLVFTKYPHDLSDWIIHYEDLLQSRLQALQALDESLISNPKIQWRYVLQTDCSNARMAKERFHGFVLHMEKFNSNMDEVEAIVYGGKEMEDSTAFSVLNRKKNWKKKLVVMDWTGSMYPYGASVVLWHYLNLADSSVKHFVFFNDGNGRSNRQKRIGKTGGIYRSTTNDIDTVLNKMLEVMENGNGGDGEENDVEALVKGTRRLKDFGEVVLIADNNSAVRDKVLVKYLKHPIRIILCGVKDDNPPHPDYLELAYKTGGSVHTIEEDIEMLSRLKEGAIVKVGGYEYRLQGGKFIIQDRS